MSSELNNLDNLEGCFLNLATEARELNLDSKISETNIPPTALEFLRSYVSRNRPLVVRGGCKNWSAVRKWTSDYLIEKIGSSVVTVAVTPNGYADAVLGSRFTLPEERRIKFSNFLEILERRSSSNGVFYLQKQNSSMTTEFNGLMDDIESHIPWATEAFGNMPDAINFWMGDARAVTSMHKDHYENIYCVIRGEKTFTILPPTDQPFIPIELFQSAIFKENSNGEFELLDDDETGKVWWIPIDPINPDVVRYPEFSQARPFRVSVSAGDMFYLPSLWYHHVQQSHGCIAVNYWHDMEYDIKYNYFKFVESLIRIRKSKSSLNSSSLNSTDQDSTKQNSTL